MLLCSETTRATAATAVITFSVVAGAQSAHADIVRNTLPLASSPQYSFSGNFVNPPVAGGEIYGRFLMVRQTILPTQTSATATMTLDASVFYRLSGSTFGWVRPVDFGPGGLLQSTQIAMTAHWFDANTFNHTNPSASLVSSQTFALNGESPVASGTNTVLRREVLRWQSYLQTPATGGMYYLGIALNIPGAGAPVPALEVQAAPAINGGVFEAPNDFIFNRGTGGSGFNPFALPNGTPQLASMRLDIPTVPAPGAAFVFVMGLGLAVSGNRRNRRGA